MAFCRLSLRIMVSLTALAFAQASFAQDSTKTTANVTAPAADPVRLARAGELAELTSPKAALVASNIKAWGMALGKSLRADASVTRLEAAFPGIIDAAIAAVRPLGEEYCRTFVDRAVQVRIEVFAEALSADELDELLAFYGSAVGQRFLSRMRSNIDPGSLITDEFIAARRTGDEVTARDTARVLIDTLDKTAKDTSVDDTLDIMRFGQKPVMGKATQAAAEAEKRILVMANNPDPQFLERQGKALQQAIIDFAERRRSQNSSSK